MSTLLSVDELRALVPSPLDDAQLSDIITRVEADISGKIGAPYVDAMTSISETILGGARTIFTRRPIESVTSITEYANLQDETGTALLEGTDFFVWASQGRIERLASLNSVWGSHVDVQYVPRDQRSKRKQASIDLVRIHLSQTALHSEDVAGEYRYQAPANWDAELQRVLRRLRFPAI